MNISLTSELENFVSQKVKSGVYLSASDVILDGLRLLKERDELDQIQLDELRKAIAVGIDQADRGLIHEFNEEAVARIKARGRERLATQYGLNTT